MSPLTTFILKMMATPRDRLLRADVAKLAAKHRISRDHAAGFIRLWVGM